MRKLRSDKSFKDFLSSGGGALKVGVLLLVGLLLMLFGTIGGDGEEKSGDSTLEDRVAELCSSVEGVGDCRVMITYDGDGEVYAVAVLCEGADSVGVRQDITELTSSLFGIGANRISVLKISP